jgi:UDPglucose--hexose-1-phosphate uridylyltransferase
MSLRKDPATGRWVVFTQNWPPPPPEEACPFCEGNERLTPHEIVAWGRDGGAPDTPGWQVRVIPNLRPMLRVEQPLERRADGLYDTVAATGAHEILIETPRHLHSLAQLPPEAVARVLGAWAQRVTDLKRDKRLRSIFVFKNHGAGAGAGLPGHAHSQVIGLPVTPKALKEILQGARRHFEVHERCVFCDILQEEIEKETRVIGLTEHFAAIAPYASRHPFEVMILPRRHDADFEAAGPEELADLARLTVALLQRLEQTLPEPAYNLFLYSGPNRLAEPGNWKTLADDFHWQIQILPRPRREGGFELGSGFYANPITPEEAAATLRLDVR